MGLKFFINEFNPAGGQRVTGCYVDSDYEACPRVFRSILTQIRMGMK